MKTRAIAAAAKLAFLFLFAQALAAQAADIKVLASPNMRPLLTDIAADFERSTGHKLLVTYDSAAAVTSQVAAGEATDVVITLRSLLDALAAQGKAKDVATIGRSFVAVVVRTGAPKPDMSSLDSFKQALLAAPSVVYSDPAKGGLSGIFAAGLIDRMGIADQIKPKLKLVQPGGADLVEAIAKGEAELGIDQLTVVRGESRASTWSAFCRRNSQPIS